MRTLIDIAIAGLLVIAGLMLGLALLFAKDGTALLIAPICTAANRTANDWTFDLWITGPLLGSGLLYAIGVIRLWSRAGLGHGVLLRQTAAFATGWFALFAALVSPLHYAGAQLFTAHMIEHELIMAVAAPLLVLARPGAGFLWAFPRRMRRGIGRAVGGDAIQGPWRALTSPYVATFLHGAVIWLWHAPLLFDDAVVNLALHRVQHISFLATAILFWWAVIRRSDYGPAFGHVFATMTHTGLLGALLTLAPRVLYGVQTAGAPAWGLTQLEDQQLAGLVMWVPAGTVYAGAALAFMGLWISRSGLRGWSADHALEA
jgi:putative membrane protein